MAQRLFHRRAQRLAQAFVEVQIFRLHNWRSISRTAKGSDPGPVGSINKLWWSELDVRLQTAALDLLGPLGETDVSETAARAVRGPETDGRPARGFARCAARHICPAGGRAAHDRRR